MGIKEFDLLNEAKKFAKKKAKQGFDVEISKRRSWTRNYPHVKQYVVRTKEGNSY